MSLCCLVLYHPSVTTQTKSLIARSIFQEELIEMEVLNPRTHVMFLDNVQKEKVWQAVVHLESTSITTVYAFGEKKEEIQRKALSYLESTTIYAAK